MSVHYGGAVSLAPGADERFRACGAKPLAAQAQEALAGPKDPINLVLFSRSVRIVLLLITVGLLESCGSSQPRVSSEPAARSERPLLLFDQGHRNFHKPTTTYAAFERLLRREGWAFETIAGPFRIETLRRGRILVIVNALAPQNARRWVLPVLSAFSSREVSVVRSWVKSGGSLLLIADHMPFAGAADRLAEAFGAQFSNGFAFDERQLRQPGNCLDEDTVHVFRRSDGTLATNSITVGVDSVATFTGSAFKTDGQSLLTFNETSVSVEPRAAWRFAPSTRRIPVAGWSQGAIKRFGRGRVAIFGEAAMFSEQTCRAQPIGMNSPLARQNGRFLLNITAWLAGGVAGGS